MTTCKNLLYHDLYVHLRSLTGAANRGFVPRGDHCNLCNADFTSPSKSSDADGVIVFRYCPLPAHWCPFLLSVYTIHRSRPSGARAECEKTLTIPPTSQNKMYLVVHSLSVHLSVCLSLSLFLSLPPPPPTTTTISVSSQGNGAEEKIFEKRKVFKEDLKELTGVAWRTETEVGSGSAMTVVPDC